MFDLSVFLSAAVKGIPLLFVVLVLVAFIKDMGASGKGLQAASLAVGLVLGVGYMLAEEGTPAGFGGWFAVIIFGLTLGLITSKYYDVLQVLANKAIEHLLDQAVVMIEEEEGYAGEVSDDLPKVTGVSVTIDGEVNPGGNLAEGDRG